MPASGSGVMFGPTSVPNGVCKRDAARKRLASRLGVAGRAIGGGREISSALYEIEGLQVDRARSSACASSETASATDRNARADGTRHVCTSGPGDFRYLEMIASAARKASAPTVPVGL